ncbi:MAG: hypothetical protein ACI36V_06490 [Coriobacteriales bacterium]
MTYELSSYEPVELVLDRNVWLESNPSKDEEDAPKPGPMRKSDPHFEYLVLIGLADRLVGEVHPNDVPEGDTLVNYRTTLAIDSLAEHRGFEVSDEELTELIPAPTREEKEAIRREFELQGLGEELKRNILREKALAWLLENSKIEYE